MRILRFPNNAQNVNIIRFNHIKNVNRNHERIPFVKNKHLFYHINKWSENITSEKLKVRINLTDFVDDVVL